MMTPNNDRLPKKVFTKEMQDDSNSGKTGGQKRMLYKNFFAHCTRNNFFYPEKILFLHLISDIAGIN